ncbi:MAG: response regulator [bacterium]|nr:response regulator [bacterium]
MREFNLCKLMSGLARVFETEAWEKGIDFTCRIRQDVPQDLQGDETRLCLLLSQLFMNAIEYTSKGAVNILVSYAREDNDAPTHRFTVTDSGCGMSVETRDSLREFLAGKVEKPPAGGPGMGLSIANKLASQLGGRIELESSSESGTVFTFQAPFISQLGSENIPCELEETARVLVVDDNETNRMVAANLLERMGHEVHSVGSGTEAIDLVAREEFTLVFMDLQMPDMDGFETTRRIRNSAIDSANCYIPIVALTAHGQMEDRNICLAAGMNDFLLKPIDREDLQCRILAALGSDGGRQVGWEFMMILDQKDLRRRICNDEELLQELLDLFLKDIPKQIAALKNGLADQDAELVMRKAHTIKGASANIGAFAMREVAKIMEGLAAHKALDTVETLCPRLLWELERFRKLVTSQSGRG